MICVANRTMMTLVRLVLVSTALLVSSLAHRQTTCGHQQEVCTCDSNAQTCEFTLEVEELQTFTSYVLEDTDEIARRGTAADTYYLDTSVPNRDFFPSLSSAKCNDTNPPPECGVCWNDNFHFLSDFAPQCSKPMTVDGNTYRLFIAVNGLIPGPTLVVSEGQIVRVKVLNKLTSEGVTIHWHGMHQRRSPWMDGVAFVSQPPIVPGAEFDYVFTATPAGTHWYHSHAGAQRTDGLFGALIVRESSSKRNATVSKYGPFEDRPEEHTLSFLDWQRESSLNLFVQLHSTLGFYEQKEIGIVPRQDNTLYTRTRSSDGIEVGPQPYWSGLINGRGRHNENTASILSSFNVEQGTTYRFRLIGAQSLFAYRFSIEAHDFRVIASDGHFFEPVRVSHLIVHTGERYDILVTANQVTNNYWIRAETLEILESTVTHTAEAILHYNGADEVDSVIVDTSTSVTNQPWTCTPTSLCETLNCPFLESPGYNCIHLHELRRFDVDTTQSDSSVVPDLVNVNSVSEVNFFNFGFEGIRSTSALNGRNFRLPVSPYQTYRGIYARDQATGKAPRSCSNCGINTPSTSSDCECTYVEQIGGSTFNSDSTPTVVFVFSAVGLGQNFNFSHPVHIHGHSFNILHIGHGEYNDDGELTAVSNDINCENDRCHNPSWRESQTHSYSSGILKDTVIVPAGGYVVVAFQADNPGYWFLHCHIESHQIEGMGVIIREYDESQHVSAPDGINMVGDFQFTIPDYRNAAAVSAEIGFYLVVGFLLTIFYL